MTKSSTMPTLPEAVFYPLVYPTANGAPSPMFSYPSNASSLPTVPKTDPSLYDQRPYPDKKDKNTSAPTCPPEPGAVFYPAVNPNSAAATYDGSPTVSAMMAVFTNAFKNEK